jgi:hypothetical protein
MEGGGYGLGIIYDAGEPNPELNVVGNVFHYVEDLNGDEDDAILFEQGADNGAVYFEGNLVPTGETDDTLSTSGPLPIPADAQVTTYGAETLGENVVPHVGTHFRTDDEQDLLDEVAAAL